MTPDDFYKESARAVNQANNTPDNSRMSLRILAVGFALAGALVRVAEAIESTASSSATEHHR